jgi:hypothetical protein
VKDPATRDDFRFVLCEYLLARLAHGNRKIVIIAADARYRHRDTLSCDRIAVLGLRKISKNVPVCKPVLIQIAREQREDPLSRSRPARRKFAFSFAPFFDRRARRAQKFYRSFALFVFVSQRR